MTIFSESYTMQDVQCEVYVLNGICIDTIL